MKTVFLLLFVAFIGLVGHAQALSGAAATYEKNFWAGIEKIKNLDVKTERSAFKSGLTQAETSLTRLKTAAPDFKTTKHDAELAKYKGMMESADNEKAAASNDAAKAQGLAALDARMIELDKARTVNTYQPEELAARIGREVATFKRSFPDHDVTAYEKKVSDFQAYISNKYKNEETAREDGEKFRSEYDKAFNGLLSFSGNVQTGNEDADRLENQRELKELEEKVNIFLATDLAKKAETLHSYYIDNNIVGSLTRKAADNDAEIAKYKKYVFEAYRKGDNWISYDELLALEIFWEGNSTLFPSHSEYKTALANTTKVIADCGSEANMEEIRKKNYGQYLTTVKMDGARAHDAALEAEIKRIFLTTPPGQNANVVKVNIVYEEWAINRHAISGVILSREREARVVTKDANGSCWVHQFGLFQRYDGSKYSASEKLYVSPSKTEILCENVR
jgi:plastocyanin